MKHEYREGKEARETFDRSMTALFRAPKTISMSQPKKKKKRKLKASASGRVLGASTKED